MRHCLNSLHLLFTIPFWKEINHAVDVARNPVFLQFSFQRAHRPQCRSPELAASPRSCSHPLKRELPHPHRQKRDRKELIRDANTGVSMIHMWNYQELSWSWQASEEGEKRVIDGIVNRENNMKGGNVWGAGKKWTQNQSISLNPSKLIHIQVLTERHNCTRIC